MHTAKAICTALGGLLLANAGLVGAQAVPPLVFVSRQINGQGSIYWNQANEQAGVGAASRVRPAAPGRLLVRESNGSIRTLVDGSAPAAGNLYLSDVNAPTVSWDGTTVVFAGLPRTPGSSPPDPGPAGNPGRWRLFAIGADGSNLRAVTSSDITDAAAYAALFGTNYVWAYDDYDPQFLPDGRLVFASTRWPAYGHYSGVRASNLWVVDLDGGRLHRITSERNGADRPLVDPLSGRIVYSRWWRNHRFASDPTDSVAAGCNTFQYPFACYSRHLGLTGDRNSHVGGADNLFRNAWQASFINLDGSGLEMFSGSGRDEEGNHVYGGGFAPDGSLVANFFPMYNMTEASGFGGLRRYSRGAQAYVPINGVFAYRDAAGAARPYANTTPNPSFGIFVAPPEGYTSEPEVLADGRIVYAAAPDAQQDYDLFVMDANGANRAPLYALPGSSELRARVLAARPVPPVLPDPYRSDYANTPRPQFLPPAQGAPGSNYARDGSFVFDALNVYGNGPVDADIISAPAIGSAASIRFFLDHQRRTSGSFPAEDWPILINELPISPTGRVTDPNAPAFLPLFEQLRSDMASGYRVPLTGGSYPVAAFGARGAAHVAGMNFGRAGSVARCIGCHAGHTQITVPASDEAARWSNLAPGTSLRVSSSADASTNGGLIDRRVLRGEIWRYWRSAQGQDRNAQWVELVFPVPVVVRGVRVYNPRAGGEANSSITVGSCNVRLYSDAAASIEVAATTTGALAVGGTTATFADVIARSVRIEPRSLGGTFYGAQLAVLGEVEVIARGVEDADLGVVFRNGFE